MFKRLATVYYYYDVLFSSKTSKPGNKGLVTTMGKGSGEEVSSGWGGARTYRNRYFFSDLIRFCQETNDEKPALKSFPCTSYLFPIATS